MRKRSETEQKPNDKAIVPVDPINEQVVIAAVCVDKRAADALLPSYTKDFFHARGHARIWDVLGQMRAAGLYYDPATVTQTSGGDVDVQYLEQLVRDRPAIPPNLRHHVEMLRWDRARVVAARGPVTSLLEAMQDATASPERVRSLAQQVLDGFTGHGSDAFLVSTSSIVKKHAAILTERREGRACYGYGIPGLDLWTEGADMGTPRMVPGAAPGVITLLTGVSGSGKSSTAARMIYEWTQQKRRVLFGSFEQPEGISLEIIAALAIGMSRSDLTKGQFTEDDQQELVEKMEELGEYLQFFKLPFGKARGDKNANDKALDLLHQVVSDSRCEIFVADLARRVLKETNPDDEEQAAFRFQAIARELEVHMLLLHQQRSKDVEQRLDKRPTREGLKGSSGWLEVADTVIGFHRENLWKNVPDDKIEAIILKQRYGRWPIAVEFDWDPEYITLERGRTIEYLRPGEESELDGFVRQGSGRRGKKW